MDVSDDECQLQTLELDISTEEITYSCLYPKDFLFKQSLNEVKEHMILPEDINQKTDSKNIFRLKKKYEMDETEEENIFG